MGPDKPGSGVSSVGGRAPAALANGCLCSQPWLSAGREVTYSSPGALKPRQGTAAEHRQPLSRPASGRAVVSAVCDGRWLSPGGKAPSVVTLVSPCSFPLLQNPMIFSVGTQHSAVKALLAPRMLAIQ